jgi:hypothetical protein
MTRTTVFVPRILFLQLFLLNGLVVYAQTDVNWSVRGNMGVTGIGVKENYFVGFSSFLYRDYFVFDLTALTKPVTSAELDLYLPGLVSYEGPGQTIQTRPGYDSPDGSETFELHDVTTPIDQLVAFFATADVYNDLGSGVFYGSRTITTVDLDTIVRVTLNASAVAAINATHGMFALGGSLSTLHDPPQNEYAFAFTGQSTDTTRLRLTLVPEPISTALIAFAAMIFGCRRHGA